MLLEHPEIAYRTCEECQRWFFDDKTGRLAGPPGRPRRRMPTDPRPNCRACIKVRHLPPDQHNPKGGARRTLSAKNWRTLEYYYEVRASGATVRDALARRNLGLIARTIDEHQRLNGQRLALWFELMAQKPRL